MGMVTQIVIQVKVPSHTNKSPPTSPGEDLTRPLGKWEGRSKKCSPVIGQNT